MSASISTLNRCVFYLTCGCKKIIRLIRSMRMDLQKNQWKKFHHYTIVHQISKHRYLIQCANLSAIFKSPIFEMAKNFELISGLIPEQACFVGVKYSEMKSASIQSNQSNRVNFSFPLLQRYGKYKICSENRNGSICFINLKTREESVLDLRTIISTPDLIQNFDSTQAFYIGILAGLITENSERFPAISLNKRPYLRVV